MEMTKRSEARLRLVIRNIISMTGQRIGEVIVSWDQSGDGSYRSRVSCYDAAALSCSFPLSQSDERSCPTPRLHSPPVDALQS